MSRWSNFTVDQAAKTPCYRCGRLPSVAAFSICADDLPERAVCAPCDVVLNRTMLRVLRDSAWRKKAARYAQRTYGITIREGPKKEKRR